MLFDVDLPQQILEVAFFQYRHLYKVCSYILPWIIVVYSLHYTKNKVFH